MADTPLDPSELDAIKEAIQQASSAKQRPAPISDAEAVPLALIADDRAAEDGRPAALRLGERWTSAARTRSRYPVRFELTLIGAEVIDGKGLRDELGGSWMAVALPRKRSGSALVAISGPVIEGVAAQLLGAEGEEEIADDAAPSPASIQVFERCGRSLAAALADAWREEEGCIVDIDATPKAVTTARSTICDADVVIALTLEVASPHKGWVRMFARPTTLLAPPTALEAIPAAPGAMEQALGNVDVEVRVDFGRTVMTMRQLRALQVGTIIPLDQFTDDPLDVECAGVVKACGRPVVYRGVLAVEVCLAVSEHRRKAA